jgi:large subunit ribosomal protein LP1
LEGIDVKNLITNIGSGAGAGPAAGGAAPAAAAGNLVKILTLVN